MAKIIGLPKLSPTMEEGTLVRWAKSEGETIEVDELLAEVETDKATMEFRSFDRGVLLAILVPAGETLRADQPVAIVGNAGEDVSALIASARSGAAAAPTAAVTSAAAPGATAAPASAAAPATSASPAVTAPLASASPALVDAGRVLASPLVRRVAREQGISLAGVSGSGPHGRIVKRDLDGAETASGAAVAAPAVLVARVSGERLAARVEKPSATRKTIARRLLESKQTIPHYYLTLDVEVTELVAARIALNAALEKEGEKVSLNDLVIKACALALRRSPSVNSSWIDDQIHFHQVVDISVAVAIPDGLVTPVVRDADQKGVVAISRDVRELASRAKAKKLGLAEMTGGTFSISNLGMFGVDSFAAVINPPEGAILAVGSVRDEPVVRHGAVVPGKRMGITLSADHRVVDGAVAAQFLALVRGYLENPVTMLM